MSTETQETPTDPTTPIAGHPSKAWPKAFVASGHVWVLLCRAEPGPMYDAVPLDQTAPTAWMYVRIDTVIAVWYSDSRAAWYANIAEAPANAYPGNAGIQQLCIRQMAGDLAAAARFAETDLTIRDLLAIPPELRPRSARNPAGYRPFSLWPSDR